MTYVPVGTQNDVITSRAPALVVLGGAGTGKTATAAAAAGAHLTATDVVRERQRRAMIAAGVVTGLPPRARVLFLSFSRTAVAQVIDRAGAVVGTLLDRIDVATFHGFAWRIVTRLWFALRLPAAADDPFERGTEGSRCVRGPNVRRPPARRPECPGSAGSWGLLQPSVLARHMRRVPGYRRQGMGGSCERSHRPHDASCSATSTSASTPR